MNNHKEIKLENGSVIVVHKSTHAMNLARVAMQIEISQKWEDKKDLSVRDQMLKQDEMLTYTGLVACSSGDVPSSYDEFSSMDGDAIEKWVEEAVRLNPRWFPDVSLEDEDEEEKKEN